MRTSIFLSSLLFGASALAAQLNERFIEDPAAILKRQQFKPSTTTAEGSTCADAFGDGYVTCREAKDEKNRLCYNPQMGQTCCQNNWACPSGAFCLVTGSCCPNGQSPKECAAANGVSISSDFHVPTSGPITNGTGTSNAKATGISAATPSKTPGSNASNMKPAGALAGALLGVAALL